MLRWHRAHQGRAVADKAAGRDVTTGGLVKTLALRRLRRYPLDVDLEVSAAAGPGVRAALQHRQTGPTVAPGCDGGALGRGDADNIRS